MSKTIQPEFSEKTLFLFEPHRYKVLYGGRGSGKSHAVARYLLLAGIAERHTILCAREVQKSIKDSVHRLLEEQIDLLGLGAHYQVLDTVIRGTNGTEFLFNGLSNQTSTSIKSLEGATKCWCEEAQTISKKSWDILIPTIRTPGSEFLITFNPELETDDTYQRFVVSPPPDCISQHINYNDNPWFPDVLEQERRHCQATATDEDYRNIWEGHCRSAVTGAIYASEVAQAATQGRICTLPYDPQIKVHAVWDMGFGDNMAVTMVQRLRSEIRIIDYLQVRQHRTDEVCALLQQKRYNWGYHFLPHDGFHKTRYGTSDEETLRRFGFRVKRTENVPVEDGIRAARNVFGQCCFDKELTKQLLECLKRYRRAETKHGGDGSPVHDEFSDGADSFRYTALNVNRMHNEDERALLTPVAPAWEPLNSSMGW